MSVGGHLYAVGGSRSIGSERSIEMFDGTQWQEVAETNGFRSDFCSLAWQDEAILVIGGYDAGGGQARTEMYNVTTGKWSQLQAMPIGRGLHSCGLYKAGRVIITQIGLEIVINLWTYISCLRSQTSSGKYFPFKSLSVLQGGMVAAGGWTETEDGWNEISHTAVWYDPASASWTQLENLKKGRTQFALEEVNGTMTAIGGFDVSVVYILCDSLLHNTPGHLHRVH